MTTKRIKDLQLNDYFRSGNVIYKVTAKTNERIKYNSCDPVTFLTQSMPAEVGARSMARVEIVEKPKVTL